MCAISNSSHDHFFLGRVTAALVISTLLGLVSFAPAALTNPPQPATLFAAKSAEAFLSARQRHEAAPTNNLMALEFARACFDRGEYATNAAERAILARQGIAACRGILRHDPTNAAAHYYLGMNLGQLARTKTLGALPIVNEMEVEFKTARQLNQHLDFAGPDRCLGLLYLDAPTIGSIGSRRKAREHLQSAAQIAPEYPDNYLNLAEALLRWNETAEAQLNFQKLEVLMPSARTNFAGESWTATWADWEKRIQKARRLVEQKSGALATPRAGR